LLAEADALLEEDRQADMRRRSRVNKHAEDGLLVYKTYQTPPGQSQQQSTSTMDEQTQKLWDAWIEAHLEKFWEDKLMPAIGYALSKIRKQARDHTDERVGKVRADLTVQNTAQRDEVQSLRGSVNFRKRDDAA
jgi:hypothetical protein